MKCEIGKVLEKLLEMPEIKKAVVRKHSGGIYDIKISLDENLPYIELAITPSNIQYGLIQVSAEAREFFPGYQKQFILETDVKPFVMHLTSGTKDTKYGSVEGGYLCHPRTTEIEGRLLRHVSDANHMIDGAFKRWYEMHPEVKPNNIIRIYKKSKELFLLEKKTKKDCLDDITLSSETS